MVNIWSTTCRFCIDEMPALEALSQSLPENVGLVSICIDASVNADAARSIVEAQGVTYPVLVDNARLGALLLLEGERDAHDYLRRQHGRACGRRAAGRSRARRRGRRCGGVP